MVLTVYGSAICADCRDFHALAEARGICYNKVDITADTASLKAFLALRDHEAAFAPVRDNGTIGIPCFTLEDGRLTLNEDEALSWIDQPPREAAPAHCACCK